MGMPAPRRNCSGSFGPPLPPHPPKLKASEWSNSNGGFGLNAEAEHRAGFVFGKARTKMRGQSQSLLLTRERVVRAVVVFPNRPGFSQHQRARTTKAVGAEALLLSAGDSHGGSFPASGVGRSLRPNPCVKPTRLRSASAVGLRTPLGLKTCETLATARIESHWDRRVCRRGETTH
jgi:hypothetical protein